MEWTVAGGVSACIRTDSNFFSFENARTALEVGYRFQIPSMIVGIMDFDTGLSRFDSYYALILNCSVNCQFWAMTRINSNGMINPDCLPLPTHPSGEPSVIMLFDTNPY
jgi:hypothetical protein